MKLSLSLRNLSSSDHHYHHYFHLLNSPTATIQKKTLFQVAQMYPLSAEDLTYSPCGQCIRPSTYEIDCDGPTASNCQMKSLLILLLFEYSSINLWHHRSSRVLPKSRSGVLFPPSFDSTPVSEQSRRLLDPLPLGRFVDFIHQSANEPVTKIFSG